MLSRRSLISALANREWQDEEARGHAKMVGGPGGMQDGEGRGIPNTAIYSPESLRVSPPGPASTLDFAVRICGMSVAGTRPSGFLIAKRIRRDRGRGRGGGSPPRKPAPRDLKSADRTRLLWALGRRVLREPSRATWFVREFFAIAKSRPRRLLWIVKRSPFLHASFSTPFTTFFLNN